MALNIKDDAIHEMARELADLKGATLTEAVRAALRHELKQEKQRSAQAGRPLVERLNEIAARCAALPDVTPSEGNQTPWDPAKPASDHSWLYDEHGLPR